MIVDKIVMTEELCTEFDLVSIGNYRRHSSSSFLFLFFFLLLATPHSLWNLSSQPGIESELPVKAPSPLDRTAGEFPRGILLIK